MKVEEEGKEDARLHVEQLRFQKMKAEKKSEESGTGYAAPLRDFDLSSEEAADASCAAAIANFFLEGNMERSTCACCNELFARKLMKFVLPQGDWLKRLTSRLSWVHTTHPLTQETRDFYDASSKVAELRDVALAPNGVVGTRSTSDEVGDYKVVRQISFFCVHAPCYICALFVLPGGSVVKLPLSVAGGSLPDLLSQSS